MKRALRLQQAASGGLASASGRGVDAAGAEPAVVAVGGGELEDLGLEVLEHGFAASEPVERLVTVRRSEPVALLHAVEPRADLVELHPDLLRLLVGVVSAEVLELDLLDEIDLAVLHDLAVVLRRLLAEEGEQL